MLYPFQLALLIIFHVQLARALDITVPAGPVLNGATISVGWAATDSDPLSFSLALLCVGKITLQDQVDRGTTTNNTGQVSYLTGCLGDHVVQALPNSSDTVPFVTSGSFQVVSAVAPTTVFTIAPTGIITSTVFQSLPSTSSSSSALSPLSTDGRIRTLEIVSALLGATTLVLGILVILLYVRLRKRRPDSPDTDPAQAWPFIAHFEEGQFRAAAPDSADSNVASLAREVREARAEIGRLRAEPQAVNETPARPRPPSYHKQQR